MQDFIGELDVEYAASLLCTVFICAEAVREIRVGLSHTRYQTVLPMLTVSQDSNGIV